MTEPGGSVRVDPYHAGTRVADAQPLPWQPERPHGPPGQTHNGHHQSTRPHRTRSIDVKRHRATRRTRRPAPAGPPQAVGPVPGRGMQAHFAALSPASQAILIIAVIGVAFLGAIDGTVVGTAMPRIVAQLHGSESAYTGVVTAYLLTSTVTVPLYGRFSDIYGRKRLLLVGLGIFVFASLLCGIAGSLTQLIVFRAFQGIGAGALLSLSIALIRDLFPLDKMARHQGLMALMLAVSFIGGPYLGGVLTEYASWRWVFLLNLPLGGLGLLALALLLPGTHDGGRPGGRLDVAGMLLLTSGLSLVVFGLNNATAPEGGGLFASGPAVTGGSLAIGAVLLAALGFVERRAAVPMLPLELFRNRALTAVTSAGALLTAGMFSAAVFLPLYFQQARHSSATASGLLILPVTVGLVIGNQLTAFVMTRTGRGRSVLGAGSALMSVGGLFFAVLTPQTHPLVVGTGLLLVGLGTAPSMGAVTVLGQAVAPREHIGTATAGLTLLKQLGGVVGLACAQTLFTRLVAQSAGTPEQAVSSGVGGSIAIVTAVSGVLALVAVAVMGEARIFTPGRPGGGPPGPPQEKRP